MCIKLLTWLEGDEEEHSRIPVRVDFLGVLGNVWVTRVPPLGLGSRALWAIGLHALLLLWETVIQW